MTAERRPIAGFPDYAVDVDGIVWSFKRGGERPLRPQGGTNGYTHVNLYRPGSAVGRRPGVQVEVHRIVLEAFVGPCPDGFMARHRDGDKSNNAVANLAWGTWPEQVADRRRHGTETPTGERNHMAQLSDAQVRQMRARRPTGLDMRTKGASGPSYRSLAAEFGCSAATAERIIKHQLRPA